MVNHQKYTSLILFADLVGSSEVGNTLTPEEYWDEYVSNFYAAVKVAQKMAKLPETPQCHVRLVGDGCEIFYREDTPTPAPDWFLTDQVHKIVRFTYILKALWFVSPFNIRRMEDHKSPREIAVGAHCGTILEIVKPKEEGTAYVNDPWFLGHTINVARRIESISRDRRNLNFCVSAPIGSMFKKLAEIAEEEQYSSEYIVYGLLKVADPENRDIKGIDPVIRVNEILPSWDQGEKANLKQIKKAKKIIKQFEDNEQMAQKQVVGGSELISEFYATIKKMSSQVTDVSKLLTPLIEYANWYAHDSWSVMLAGLSLLSMAEFNPKIADEAKKTGKTMMRKLLKDIESQEVASGL